MQGVWRSGDFLPVSRFVLAALPSDIKRAATQLTFKNKLRPFFSQNIYADFTAFYHRLLVNIAYTLCPQKSAAPPPSQVR